MLNHWRTVVFVFVSLFCTEVFAKPRVYPGVLLTAKRQYSISAGGEVELNRVFNVALPVKKLGSNSVLVSDWRNRFGIESLPTAIPYERRSNICKLARIRKIIKNSHGKLSCEPNWELTTFRNLPSDPSFYNLYGLDQRNDIDINAPEAWDFTTGSDNVVVAVIDSGIDYTHPDLAANAGVDGYFGYDYVNNDADPMDDNGHGTHCSGTIGGTGNNDVGVTGVNWKVRLLGMKFLNASGSGSTSGAVNAINALIAYNQSTLVPKGKKLVTSNSWGGGSYSNSLYNAISAANSAGILFIVAAGNSSTDNDTAPTYPANYNLPNMVRVAAVGSSGGLASFSNYGLTTVDVSAPGVNILSTIPGNRYAYYSGTSMATPHVAGLAALLYSSCMQASMTTIREAIFQTRALASTAGKTVTGGEIDALAAIQYVAAHCPNSVPPTATATPSPTSPPSETATATPTDIPANPAPSPEPTIIPPTVIPTSTPTVIPVATIALDSPSTVSPGESFAVGIAAPGGKAATLGFFLDGRACPSVFLSAAGSHVVGRFTLGSRARFFQTLSVAVVSGNNGNSKNIDIQGGHAGQASNQQLRGACPKLLTRSLKTRQQRWR